MGASLADDTTDQSADDGAVCDLERDDCLDRKRRSLKGLIKGLALIEVSGISVQHHRGLGAFDSLCDHTIEQRGRSVFPGPYVGLYRTPQLALDCDLVPEKSPSVDMLQAVAGAKQCGLGSLAGPRRSGQDDQISALHPGTKVVASRHHTTS